MNIKKYSLACTSKENAWLPPALKDCPLAEVRSINFSPPQRERQRLLQDDEFSTPHPPPRQLPKLSQDEFDGFLKSMHDAGLNLAFFRVTSQYCEEFAPKSVADGLLPCKLSDLYDSNCSNLSFPDLFSKGCEIFNSIVVTPDQSNEIEVLTRKQACTHLWKSLRAGRITASVMYQVLRTRDLSQPSLTVLKMICYPFHNTYEGYWMKRGKDLEPKVRDWYYDKMNSVHTNFRVREAGLFIPPDHPFIGASPDGFVRCDCHGVGLLEIKCPKYPNLDDDFVLPKYLYQMQTQLLCVGSTVTYCDYVVYHPTYTSCKRIYRDSDIFEEILEGSKIYFKQIVLPELLGRYFTSLKRKDNSADGEEEEELVCYCQTPREGPMVRCVSGIHCHFEWYHTACVQLRQPPKNWKCDLCKEIRK